MSDFYKKLVDLYAGRELTEELEDELESEGFRDSDLSYEMTTLRKTVDTLKSCPAPEFTEESYHRILLKLYARTGEDMETTAPTPTHMQYSLPIHT